MEIIPTDNTVQAIYSNITNISIADFKYLRGLSWSQILAMLTIFHAEMVASSIHSLENWKDQSFLPKPSIDDIHKMSRDYLPEAYQALTYAEVLNDQEHLFKVLKTEKARAASIKKHSERYNPLQQKIESIYWDSYQHDSARSAARKIFEKLIADKEINYDIQSYRLYFNNIDYISIIK